MKNSKLVLDLDVQLPENWVVTHHWPRLWHLSGFARPIVDCFHGHGLWIETSFWTCLGDQEGEGKSQLAIVNLEGRGDGEKVDPCDRS